MALIAQLQDMAVTDLDAFRASTRENWPQISRIQASSGSQFRIIAGRFKTDDIMIVEVSSSGHAVRFEELPYVTISIPTSSTIRSSSSSRSAEAGVNLAFYQDGSAAEFACGAGYLGYHINFDKLAMRRFFESYFGASMPTVFRLGEPFAVSHVAALVHEVRMLEYELQQRPDADFAPAARRAIADRFMRAVLSSPLGGFAKAVADHSGAPRATHSAVRRAVDFICENHALPIISQDIGRASGANLRSLQLAFRGLLGTSVWQFLTMRRLENVRHNLCNPDYPATVTDAALLAGFTHLGEFGLQYKARFRETPGATLRAARRRMA